MWWGWQCHMSSSCTEPTATHQNVLMSQSYTRLNNPDMLYAAAIFSEAERSTL